VRETSARERYRSHKASSHVQVIRHMIALDKLTLGNVISHASTSQQ
jgi:hypothetical protein